MRIFFSFLTIISLFLFLFTSCSKDYGTTTVEGKVVDATTGEPVPYATVSLGSRAKEVLSSGYGHKESYQADANGNYSFSFDAISDGSYGVDAGYNDLYFSNDGYIPIDGGRKNKNIEIKIKPGGWIRFHVKDEEPRGDVASFLVQSFISPSYVRISNPPKDTTFVVFTYGNKNEPYVYWVKINYEETKTIGEVQTKALDTVDAYIKF